MAKYKNREVNLLEEFPHGEGAMVRIEHKEPGTMGVELVPKSEVLLTREEKDIWDKKSKELRAPYDFKVEVQEGTSVATVEHKPLMRAKK